MVVLPAAPLDQPTGASGGDPPPLTEAQLKALASGIGPFAKDHGDKIFANGCELASHVQNFRIERPDGMLQGELKGSGSSMYNVRLCTSTDGQLVPGKCHCDCIFAALSINYFPTLPAGPPMECPRRSGG